MDRNRDQRFFESLAEDTEAEHGDARTRPGVDVFGLTREQDIDRLREGEPTASLINGRYALRNELGSGGFANVYRAWDENLQRDVAVKIMRPELLQAEQRESFLKRFEREALLVARLDHNHLAPVYETGLLTHKGQDTAFIAMKYLEGQDLSDVLRHEDLSTERTLTIINQTLEALAYIHSEGVVHKDLKPSNIFLCQDHLGRDHTYLMDFGIAHDTQDAQGRLTNTGVLTGTFQYMPPEYVLMHQATPSVDVFQMGLIITEALTGVALIHRNTTLPALVARYLRRDPLDLPAELANSPAGAVIARALMLDVEDRYADAHELMLAFSALTVSDFPERSPDLLMAAELHSEELLSNPDIGPPLTRPTHAEIPSALEDEGPRSVGATGAGQAADLAPLTSATPGEGAPLAALTEPSTPSPRSQDKGLYVVGVLLALSILGAIGAVVMLSPGGAPATSSVTSTDDQRTAPVASGTATPNVEEHAEERVEAKPPVEDTPPTKDTPPPIEAPDPDPTEATPPPSKSEAPTKKTEPKKSTTRKPSKKKPTRKKPVEKKPVEKTPAEKKPAEKKPTITLPPD